MALGSTIYNFDINLSDLTKDSYQTISLKVAQHSSESLQYMICRVLAYCLEYREGLEFSKGLSEPELPAIWAHDLTGKVICWIEIGNPSHEKIHKAAKVSEHVAIYTHKNPQLLIEEYKGEKIHRLEEIKIYSIDSVFIDKLANLLERRNAWEMSNTEDGIYLNIGNESLSTFLQVHKAHSE